MLNSIQLCRGLAAIAVVAFHLSILMGESRYGGVATFRNFTLHGNLGVDFFFVLSGFIILHAHTKDIGNPIALQTYLIKRFVRVYPVYWLYTLGLIFLILVGLGHATQLPNSLCSWLNSFSLIRLSSEQTPIAPAWTLFHEVGFYFMFSLLILNKSLGKLCFFIWFCFILANFKYVTEYDRNALNVYMSLHNINFFLGMCSYYAYKKCNDSQAMVLLSLGLIIFVFLVQFGFSNSKYNQLSYGLFFALIVSGLARVDNKVFTKTPSFMILVGNASYSIYLLHLMLLGFLLKILIVSGIYQHFGDKMVFISTFLLAVFATIMVYLVIERPLVSRVRYTLINATSKRPS